MELNDLKNTWSAFDERLKRNEAMEERIIMEMIRKNIARKTNKIAYSSIFSIVILLLVIPFIIYSYENHGGKYITWDILSLTIFIVAISAIPVSIYSLYLSMKINPSGNVRDNILYFNKLELFNKRSIIPTCIIIVTFLILSVLAYMQMKATLPLWTFLVCIFVLTIFLSFYSYKKFFSEIAYIKENLKELEDLKKEKS